MVNGACFSLEKDQLDFLYEERVLETIVLINHYLRCIVIDYNREETAQIPNEAKRAYLREGFESGVRGGRYDGRRRTGAAHSTMVRSITDHLTRLGQYTPHVRFLFVYGIELDYLVTNQLDGAVQDLEVIRLAARAIPREEYRFPYVTEDGKLEKESFESMYPYIANKIQRLRIIDNVKFKECMRKLIEYSTNKETLLPLELQRDYGQ